MKFDKEASWYPEYEAELLTFTGVTDAVLDDQFDSTALLSLGFDKLPIVEEDDFKDEEEWQEERFSRHLRTGGESAGRSAVTGY